VSFLALRALASGIREQGAVAHAYAPVYAADLDFADEHPEMMLYQGDGAVERFFDLIKIANPANKQWQDHFALPTVRRPTGSVSTASTSTLMGTPAHPSTRAGSPLTYAVPTKTS